MNEMPTNQVCSDGSGWRQASRCDEEHLGGGWRRDQVVIHGSHQSAGTILFGMVDMVSLRGGIGEDDIHHHQTWRERCSIQPLWLIWMAVVHGRKDAISPSG